MTYFATGKADIFEALHNHLLRSAGRKRSSDAKNTTPTDSSVKPEVCLQSHEFSLQISNHIPSLMII